MKILLLGKNGQVGWELQRALAPLGELIAIERNSQDYCGDLTNPKKLAETIRTIKPNIIVNAAAYTAVDKAESEPKIAELINSESIKVLAQEAENLGAWLIHYSTDYVFSGDGQIPWSESDKKSPLSVYGSSKSNGEDQIQKYCTNYLIFRTSWVYSSHGNNFAKTILRLSHERESLSIIEDQFGTPTSAELIADCTAHAIKVAIQQPNVSGLYHLVASGFTNWFEYAQLVIEKAKEQELSLLVKNLIGIPATEYPLPAKRPYNSRMDNNKFKNTFNITLPDWKFGVIRMVTELTNK